jgi:hypothetical protein
VSFHMLRDAPEDTWINDAVRRVKETLNPAGEAAALSGIEYATRLLSSKPLAQDVLAGYAAILAVLPPDLLGRAVRNACAGTTYHKLPVPGVFLQAVEKDFADRKEQLAILLRHQERIQLLSQMRSRGRNQLALVSTISAQVVEATSAE